MAIPTAYKISEDGGGDEQGHGKRFWGKMVYRIPHDEVETYRGDFTPGLLTGGVSAYSNSITSAGIVTLQSTGFAASQIGNPITIGAFGAYFIEDYTSASTADTSFEHSAAVGTTAGITIQTQQIWPGKSGLLAPRLTRYRLKAQYPGVGGHSRITTIYERPSLQQLVEESTGRAMIEMDVMGVSQKLKREETAGPGSIIEGPDWLADKSGSLRLSWRVTDGDNVTWRPGITQFVIKAATPQSQVDTLQDVIGKVNNSELTNFGSPGSGSIMLIGTKMVSRLPVANFWLIDYYFARDPGSTTREPWHCRSIREEDVVLSVDTRDISGGIIANQTASMMTKILWRSADAGGTLLANSADRVLHKGYTSFLDLNTKLEWLNEL